MTINIQNTFRPKQVNTLLSINLVDSIFISLLPFGLSGISVVFPVTRVFPVNLGTRVQILACILAKCELKKQIARWYFLYLHFLARENLGPLAVVLILDINLLSNLSLNAVHWRQIFSFLSIGKPCQWRKFTLDTTSMRRRNTINSPAWSGLSQVSANHMHSNFRL